jgi:hypothetical protein
MKARSRLPMIQTMTQLMGLFALLNQFSEVASQSMTNKYLRDAKSNSLFNYHYYVSDYCEYDFPKIFDELIKFCDAMEVKIDDKDFVLGVTTFCKGLCWSGMNRVGGSIDFTSDLSNNHNFSNVFETCSSEFLTNQFGGSADCIPDPNTEEYAIIYYIIIMSIIVAVAAALGAVYAKVKCEEYKERNGPFFPNFHPSRYFADFAQSIHALIPSRNHVARVAPAPQIVEVEDEVGGVYHDLESVINNDSRNTPNRFQKLFMFFNRQDRRYAALEVEEERVVRPGNQNG